MFDVHADMVRESILATLLENSKKQLGNIYTDKPAQNT